jgi:hypothetical protein
LTPCAVSLPTKEKCDRIVKPGEEKHATELADETRKVQPVLRIDASNGESGVHYRQPALEAVRVALNEVDGALGQG